MCRFVLITAPTACDMRPLLQQFATMCAQSHGLDGSGWQGDGWGLAWKDAAGHWQVQRSVAPIWTEPDRLAALPRTRHLLAHARSASFAQHVGDLAYCQPYVHGPYAFVFNGFLQGVRLPRRVPGSLGTEKIWALVQAQLALGEAPQQALASVYALLERHSRRIQACNLGLSDGQRYAFYNGNPQGEPYYQLHQAQQEALHLVCSEPFGTLQWQRYAGSPPT
ncbi:MAG: class II glutamine amidotransferase [Candidatus Tectimicrobiota bacterium]